MNLNILSYLLYFIIMAATIVQVGLSCYRNGNVYVANILPHNLTLCRLINKVLLVGYYLVNLGYTVYIISTWEAIHTHHDLISHIAEHSGTIILLLAFLHYMNMAGIYILFNKQSLSKF